jgi:DNA-binding MarR family transcriptional regulator
MCGHQVGEQTFGQREENWTMAANRRLTKTQAGQEAATETAGTRRDLRILNAIRQIIRAADIDSRRLAAQHHITAPQLMCLMAVVEMESVTTADVARRIHLGRSTLVGILDRLEAKGLVRRLRNAEDRREVAVTPTDEGRALVAKTPFPLQHSLARALAQLSAKERKQEAASMERLAQLMGAADIEPTPMLEIIAFRKHQNCGVGIRRGGRRADPRGDGEKGRA